MLTCIDDRLTLVLDPTNGAFKGAHRDRVFEVRDGDEVLGVRQKSGEPITAATLATVLPDASALLAQILALTAERDAAVTARDVAEQARDAAVSERDALQAQIDATSAAVDGDGVPLSVTAYQARVALMRSGMLDAADAFVAAADGEIAIAWEYATVFQRRSTFILGAQTALGLTDDQVDDLFLVAASVE